MFKIEGGNQEGAFDVSWRALSIMSVDGSINVANRPGTVMDATPMKTATLASSPTIEIFAMRAATAR